MYSCYYILECYNLFSGIKLSMRSFYFILLRWMQAKHHYGVNWVRSPQHGQINCRISCVKFVDNLCYFYAENVIDLKFHGVIILKYAVRKQHVATLWRW